MSSTPLYLLGSVTAEPAEIPVGLLLTELMIIATVAVVVKHVRLPYTIALVAAGLGVGVLRAQHYLAIDLKLTPDMVFIIFLPALLFEAAFNLHVNQLRQNLKPILLLAVIGVVMAALGVAYGLEFWLGLPLGSGLVFGALIAATDPISVLAIFKELRAPVRLSVLIEGESLLNDGAAVVVFKIILAFVLTGQLSIVGAGVQFLIVSIGGVVLGLALGVLVSQITAMVDDHLIEITLSTILAYGTFIAAEHLKVSGVMAVIAAGLVYGNYGVRIGMSANTLMMMKAFWEYMGFLMNSLVFLLIGTQVDLRLLADRWQLVLVAFIVVLIMRIIVVGSLSPLGAALSNQPIPGSWQAIMVWSGLRGSISMALAMGLPSNISGRENIILMTFGVVILSLFVQGLSIRHLLRGLKITGKTKEVLQFEETLGRLLVHDRACQELERLRSRYHITEDIYQELLLPHQQALKELEKKLDQLGATDTNIRDEVLRDAARNVLAAQVSCLHDAHQRGLISDQILEKLIAELAKRQLAIHQLHSKHPPDQNDHQATISTPKSPTPPDDNN